MDGLDLIITQHGMAPQVVMEEETEMEVEMEMAEEEGMVLLVEVGV